MQKGNFGFKTPVDTKIAEIFQKQKEIQAKNKTVESGKCEEENAAHLILRQNLSLQISCQLIQWHKNCINATTMPIRKIRVYGILIVLLQTLVLIFNLLVRFQ
mgnify:CR=1 FL=1